MSSACFDLRVLLQENLCIANTLLPTRLLMLMRVKHIISYLYIQPSVGRVAQSI
jgi:hypothetical protein